MKKKIFMSMAVLTLAAAIIFIACKKNQAFQPQSSNAGPLAVDPCGCKQDNGQYKDTVTLPFVISANRVLRCDTLWRLNGKTYVTNNAVLTIPAGARIEGVRKSIVDSISVLTITRGSRIAANGTASCPIVFSSSQASPAPSDWGGIVILGRAPINRADTSIKALADPNLPAGLDINYGGGGACLGNANDNSGLLNFVRIEYAGIKLSESYNLNGLTLGAVGRGTTLQNIQVAYGGGDGFQFLGGTVNARRLISFGNYDDDLDFDLGWIGKIQFGVTSKVPDISYSSNPNGIESDNTPNGSCATCNATLDSAKGAILTNLTIIGSDDCSQSARSSKNLLNGALFRNGSFGHIKNSIFIDWPTAITATGACTPRSACCNILHATNAVPTNPNPINDFCSNTIFSGCFTGFGNSQVGMVAPYATMPNYTLQAGSIALSGACFQGLTGVIVTTYRGAFPASTAAGANWTSGWARWNF